MRAHRWSRAALIGPAMVLAACISSPSPTTSAAPTPPAAVLETPRPTPRPSATPEPLRSLPGAVGSPGCAQPVPEPGDHTIELTIDAQVRSTLLHVPPGLVPATPLPLVIVFHGAFMDVLQMVDVTGFSARAESGGFLVAYPSAVGDRLAWNAAEQAGQVDDVAFERALVDALEGRYCVDQRRVYAAGLSMGGAMTQLAACRDRRIVAIALVAAVHGDAGTRCLARRDVPTIALHGMLDPLVPWRGGLNPLPEFADHAPYDDVLQWATTWAVRNGCDAEPRELDPIADWVVPFEWQGCRAPVVVYRVGNGGHSWPGSAGPSVFGTVNDSIDATDLSVEFLLASALPPEPRIYSNDELGYRVEIPEGWPLPWDGRYGYHSTLSGAVTFPVGEPLTLDVWATQIVLSVGPIRTGIPTTGGSLRGADARSLAGNLIDEVPGYAISDLDLSVDGEAAVVLEGSNGGAPLPLTAIFTHRDRAFLLFVYHEVPIAPDDEGSLNEFLAGFEFTE